MILYCERPLILYFDGERKPAAYVLALLAGLKRFQVLMSGFWCRISHSFERTTLIEPFPIL